MQKVHARCLGLSPSRLLKLKNMKIQVGIHCSGFCRRSLEGAILEMEGGRRLLQFLVRVH